MNGDIVKEQELNFEKDNKKEQELRFWQVDEDIVKEHSSRKWLTRKNINYAAWTNFRTEQAEKEYALITVREITKIKLKFKI